MNGRELWPFDSKGNERGSFIDDGGQMSVGAASYDRPTTEHMPPVANAADLDAAIASLRGLSGRRRDIDMPASGGELSTPRWEAPVPTAGKEVITLMVPAHFAEALGATATPRPELLQGSERILQDLGQ